MSRENFRFLRTGCSVRTLIPRPNKTTAGDSKSLWPDLHLNSCSISRLTVSAGDGLKKGWCMVTEEWLIRLPLVLLILASERCEREPHRTLLSCPEALNLPRPSYLSGKQISTQCPGTNLIDLVLLAPRKQYYLA